MKKIIISAPFLSRSGYGEMARFAFSVLLQHQDEYDIYINILNWGQTNSVIEENPIIDAINSFNLKTKQMLQATNGNIQFDVSLQITIPNEWKKMAMYNIGYTAGIETTLISPAWLEPSNAMDKIITISEFSKSVFENTVFNNQQGQQVKVTTPIDVVYFPVFETQQIDLNLNLENDFNFLSVNQWGPRKDIETLISSFVEEFRNEKVGLVLKANFANNSSIDKYNCEKALKELLDSKGKKDCKVTLIHGDMSDNEMSALYRHPKIKSFVTSTHGEGFGMPIFEATQAQLPVIATDWSGHLEFLTMPDEQGKSKKMFGKVDFELKNIHPNVVWPGVMESQSGWAYVNPASLRSRMREVYKDYPRFKSWAKKLSDYNLKKFEAVKVYDSFYKALTKNSLEDELIVL